MKGKKAVLDYSAYRPFNKRHGMEPGRMELRFASTTRQEVSALYWDGDPLVPSEATFSVEDAVLSPAVQSADDELVAKYGVALLRPAQARLRASLGIAYGERCALSGAPVAWTLEAAHLIPFDPIHPEHLQNSILLRADLHRLLDADQLAFEPTTLIARFSSECLDWPEYRRLNGKTLSQPQPGFTQFGPRAETLEDRWHRFNTLYSSIA